MLYENYMLSRSRWGELIWPTYRENRLIKFYIKIDLHKNIQIRFLFNVNNNNDKKTYMYIYNYLLLKKASKVDCFKEAFCFLLIWCCRSLIPDIVELFIFTSEFCQQIISYRVTKLTANQNFENLVTCLNYHVRPTYRD